MSKLVIGKYIRLSQSDKDLTQNECKCKVESESISNQRSLIQQYIDSNPLLKNCQQYEFFDDGFSGTNFERPGFKRLLEKVKSNEINCVIVKDFSRFGRNYIELGDYIERIFPFLGVRFISINDNYDSEHAKKVNTNLDMAMKNIVYDFYSKDLSAKVTEAMRFKIKQGLYTGGLIPYGFKIHDTIKGKFTIDEEAAVIVKRIFKWAIEGFKTNEIALKLNEENILTPAQYYVQKNPHTNRFKHLNKNTSWEPAMVLTILKRKTYYGAMIGHKTEIIVPGSQIKKVVPIEEQIIVEDVHEAIITKEEWIKAQDSITLKPNHNPIISIQYPLKGKARCGYCGKALQYVSTSKETYFICNASRYNPKAKCINDKLFVTNIETTVLRTLKALFANLDKLEDNITQLKSKKQCTFFYVAEQISTLEKILKQKEATYFLLMDQLNDNIISTDVFLEKKNKIKSEIDTLRNKIDIFQQKQVETAMLINPEMKPFMDDGKKYSTVENLTDKMVQTFIEIVLIFDNQHIEIKWNFSDELYKMIFC